SVEEEVFQASRRVFTAPEVLSGAAILHPARLMPWKRVHLSIVMLARLRQIGLSARLIVTDATQITDWHGEASTYRADLVRLVESFGLQDSVDFRSATYADMPSLYAEADLVVYPTVGDEPYG